MNGSVELSSAPSENLAFPISTSLCLRKPKRVKQFNEEKIIQEMFSHAQFFAAIRLSLKPRFHIVLILSSMVTFQVTY